MATSSTCPTIPTTRSSLLVDYRPPTSDLRPLALATLAGLAALLVLGLLGWSVRQRLESVIIEVDGVEHVVQTSVRDAPALLASLGFVARPEDAVQFPDDSRIVIERARPVRIAVDGGTQEVWSGAETIGELLEEAGVQLGHKDEIIVAGLPVDIDAALPPVLWQNAGGLASQLPWKRMAEPLAVSIRRAVPVTIIDGDSLPATIQTTASSVGEALARAETPIYPGDTIFPELESPLVSGQRIVLRRATPVRIAMAGETLDVRTQQKSVGQALAEQGVIVMGMDKVTPALVDAPAALHRNSGHARARRGRLRRRVSALRYSMVGQRQYSHRPTSGARQRAGGDYAPSAIGCAMKMIRKSQGYWRMPGRRPSRRRKSSPTAPR